MAGVSSTSIVELIPMPAEVRPTCFRYALSAGVLRRDGPGLTQGAGRGDPAGRRAARGSFAIVPRPPRASGKAPRARDAMRTSLGVWRQTSRSRGQGGRTALLGCGWRVASAMGVLIRGTDAGAGPRARDAHGVWSISPHVPSRRDGRKHLLRPRKPLLSARFYSGRVLKSPARDRG